MRVLLINPPYTRFKGLVQRYFPIGLGYIAATLKRAGHDVVVYNAENPALDEGVESWGLANRLTAFEHYQQRLRREDDPVWREVRTVLDMVNPEVVGIGCMTVTYEIANRVMKIARAWNPSVPLVWGGPHSTEVPLSVISLSGALAPLQRQTLWVSLAALVAVLMVPARLFSSVESED